MLTDPVLDILLDLAQGGFGEDEAAARAMLLGETGIPGCLDRASLVNVHDHEGSSPLIHAVLCQRLEVSTATRLGAVVYCVLFDRDLTLDASPISPGC